MPAARYWRITGILTPTAALELKGVAVWSQSARVDSGATISSTINPTTGDVSTLKVGGSAVRWADASAPGFSLVWDFGSATNPYKFVITAGASSNEFIRSMQVSYSTDGNVWTYTRTKDGIAYPGDGANIDIGAYDGDDTPSGVELILGADSYVDSSNRNRLVTPGATSSIVASSRHGENSFSFNNVATDEIGVATDANMNLTGQFTVEFWVYPRSYTNNFGSIIGTGSTGTWGAGQFVFRFHKLSGVYSGRLALVTYEQSYVIVANNTPSLNAWHHVAFVRDAANSLRLYIDGVLDASLGVYTDALNFSNFPTARVGGLFFGDTVHRLDGLIDDLRITKGLARYTGSSFTLPNYDFARPSVTTPYLAPTLDTEGVSPTLITTGPVQPISLNTPKMLPTFDIYDGGKGRIVGTVKEKSSPSNLPLKRRVVLINYNDHRKVRETWSDPLTGAYVFEEIELNRKYTVIAFDHTESYRAVIADNLSPEPM